MIKKEFSFIADKFVNEYNYFVFLVKLNMHMLSAITNFLH